MTAAAGTTLATTSRASDPKVADEVRAEGTCLSSSTVKEFSFFVWVGTILTRQACHKETRA